jgi:preprotein translocase subunit SecB
MGNGSITASVQLLSYKMDKIEFSATQTIGTILSVDSTDWEAQYSFSLRNALRFINNDRTAYVTGLRSNVSIVSKSSGTELAKGIFEITGLFSTDGTLDKQTEENLAKFQGPAILLPYMRSSVSSVLSSAGFGACLMPLININEAARNANIVIEDRQLNG